VVRVIGAAGAAGAQGIAHEVGGVEPGMWADPVFWHPTHFGVEPSPVMKGSLPPPR